MTDPGKIQSDSIESQLRALQVWGYLLMPIPNATYYRAWKNAVSKLERTNRFRFQYRVDARRHDNFPVMKIMRLPDPSKHLDALIAKYPFARMQVNQRIGKRFTDMKLAEKVRRDCRTYAALTGKKFKTSLSKDGLLEIRRLPILRQRIYPNGCTRIVRVSGDAAEELGLPTMRPGDTIKVNFLLNGFASSMRRKVHNFATAKKWAITTRIENKMLIIKREAVKIVKNTMVHGRRVGYNKYPFVSMEAGDYVKIQTKNVEAARKAVYRLEEKYPDRSYRATAKKSYFEVWRLV